MARSLWLQEALAADAGTACPPLAGAQRADVCIVGAGFAGLWTALRLKQLDPACDVVLIDADIVGGGASGRNGGFVLNWWAKLEGLVAGYGESRGLRLASAADESVREIGEFVARHGIECEWTQQGWLWVATAAAQIGSWEPAVEACERRGIDAFERLSPEQLHERIGEPTHLAGVHERRSATVQPAALARGLRRVALERGVRIHEGTPMTHLDRRTPPTVRTPAGAITADAVVLTLGGWCAEAIPELRRSVVPVSSEVVASEPVPDLLAAMHWVGGEAIADARLLVHYYRTTRSGRVVFGKGGGGLAFHGRVGRGFDHHPRRSAEAARRMRELLPTLAGARLTNAWSGPVDRSVSGSPFFGRLGDGVSYVAGFSGNGVGPSHLAGKVLASMALRRDDEWSGCGLVGGRQPGFPPEPIRYAGGRVVREAVRRVERAQDTDRDPGRAARILAGFAPGGFAAARKD